MRGQLTDRQCEILSVAIQLTDERRVAETLGIAYRTLKNQLEDIKGRLNLDDRFIQFGALAIGGKFVSNRVRYEKVPHAMDRYGGYNAQDRDGHRHLFQRMDIVERITK
jgi:DNA-binding CsgD family transcriptional regulator